MKCLAVSAPFIASGGADDTVHIYNAKVEPSSDVLCPTPLHTSAQLPQQAHPLYLQSKDWWSQLNRCQDCRQAKTWASS